MSDKVREIQKEVGLEDANFNDNNQDSREQAGDQEPTATEEQVVAAAPAQAEEEEEPASMPPPATPAPPQADRPASDSKFFAIRTTGGQERVVASLLQTRVNAKKIGIRSIMVLDSFKGYIIVEAPDSNVAYEALSGIRHVRGQIRGDLPFKDIEGYLVKKPVVSELNIDDTVEVIAGPFKSMKAKITRVDYEKQEATVVLLDSPYQIPVTVDANYLKRIPH